MYGGNKNKRDKVKGHKGPQRQGWCGEACIHVHLCLFVKGTKKLTTWSPPDSQVPEETASLPGPYPERFTAPADTEGPPSMLHGSPVLEAFTQSPLMMWGCYCMLYADTGIWAEGRVPSLEGPVQGSRAELLGVPGAGQLLSSGELSYYWWWSGIRVMLLSSAIHCHLHAHCSQRQCKDLFLKTIISFPETSSVSCFQQ